MSEEHVPPVGTKGPSIDREPVMLDIAEHVLHETDRKVAGEVAEVAIIFYVAVGTIAGALGAACLYPLLVDFDPVHRTTWIFFLLIAVAAGSAVGFAIVSTLLNMKGLIRWERKQKP